ncbi:MAG: sirohydrochlorin cobaltochelatase [Rhodospirillales bacterium RIFCSPLOWO2_12_FULL_58_28]|nr:MAG: sirohydrochlorin cobaltochelatase [Rhodospirillales bacterium RIFCSPLOWO2_02_FULL_58_16]OHC78605.1 MAG: sirohydrochlorin cobaltochelatase [Rhodospirillales bacterium RIFCSPLOWO2_12_FULL_58_28]
MICGHGSRDVEAIAQFNTLSGHIKRRLPRYDVESGFLEFARPVIRDGLEKLKARGAKRILCLPGMLFAAGHVKNDLPSEVNEFAADNPGIDVRYGRELAVDARLLKAASERIEQAENLASAIVERKDTLLMVVGRGTNDSDANANVSKVARMLWEGMGFGWACVSYSGVAYPLVDVGLAHAVKLGFKRIIVFSYFLFTGILVKRIYVWADEAAAANPEIEFIKAGYLNDHPLLIDCLVERVDEMLTGDNTMNCRLCKYREQIIGYESDVGAPQVGHHHHVRGISGDDHHHDHDHDHHHDHHHHGDKG